MKTIQDWSEIIKGLINTFVNNTKEKKELSKWVLNTVIGEGNMQAPLHSARECKKESMQKWNKEFKDSWLVTGIK